MNIKEVEVSQKSVRGFKTDQRQKWQRQSFSNDVRNQSEVKLDQWGVAACCSGGATRQQTAAPAAPSSPVAPYTWQLFPLATGPKIAEPRETALQSVRVQPEGQETSTWRKTITSELTSSSWFSKFLLWFLFHFTWSLSADMFPNSLHSRDGAWQHIACDVTPSFTVQRFPWLWRGCESDEISAVDIDVHPREESADSLHTMKEQRTLEVLLPSINWSSSQRPPWRQPMRNVM